jgi:hypothetical protein
MEKAIGSILGNGMIESEASGENKSRIPFSCCCRKHRVFARQAVLARSFPPGENGG